MRNTRVKISGPSGIVIPLPRTKIDQLTSPPYFPHIVAKLKNQLGLPNDSRRHQTRQPDRVPPYPD